MEDIIINTLTTIPASSIRFRFSRSSGKGGQNVNKVSTKVELIVEIDKIKTADRTKNRIQNSLANKLDTANCLRIVSQESRSQWQNKKSAIEKLIRIVSDAAMEESERVATRPTYSSKIVRVKKKKKEGQQKKLRRKDISASDD